MKNVILSFYKVAIFPFLWVKVKTHFYCIWQRSLLFTAVDGSCNDSKHGKQVTHDMDPYGLIWTDQPTNNQSYYHCCPCRSELKKKLSSLLEPSWVIVVLKFESLWRPIKYATIWKATLQFHLKWFLNSIVDVTNHILFSMCCISCQDLIGTSIIHVV